MKNRISSIYSPNGGKKRKLAISFPSPDGKTEPLGKPLKRSGFGARGGQLAPNFSLRGFNQNCFGDQFGFGHFLNEIGRFNPIFVSDFHLRLMRRSVFPRLALTILKAALSERQYVVEGDDPRAEAFHQQWIDRTLPGILARATNAIWFGWQPFVINWEREDGFWRPAKFADVDVFTTLALEDPETREFAGLLTDTGRFGLDRAFKLTWNEELGNPYGEGQGITCFPYWWAASVMLVWKLRYFERSVDPIRIAFARNTSVYTGKDANGAPITVDLTELIAEALDAASGGDSIACPLGEGEDGRAEDLVKFETFDMPDRADQWMNALSFLEQRQFMAALSLPGIGVATGETSFAEGRITDKTQIRLLEFASEMPVCALNEQVIPFVHQLNNLPGKPPRVKGKAFKREQEETLRELLKAHLKEIIPDVGKDGQMTGKEFRVGDKIRWDVVLKTLDIAGYENEEVARERDSIPETAPGTGGRPTNPTGGRAEDRNSGLER